MFSDQDIQQIQAHGLTVNAIEQQIATFQSGAHYSNIHTAATLDNGILKLNDAITKKALATFEDQRNHTTIVKFVPASGAATRMFKFLFRFLKDYSPLIQSLNAYINRNNLKALPLFLIGLEKFPFYDAVLEQLKATEIDYNALNPNEKAHAFVKAMLDSDQLNYGSYPKGLLPFHKYKSAISTAFEEHLFDMAFFGTPNTPLQLHFTISEQHQHIFAKAFEAIEDKVERITGHTYNITFSYQHKSTDTIAVTTTNDPFRNEDGSLYFRPSGHGALLKNLNTLDADLIFISNIDNVVVKQHKAKVAKYKKILAGILLDVQQQVFTYIKRLKTEDYSEETLNEIGLFLARELNVSISEEFEKYSHNYKVEYLLNALNKPIRVCGMVKNEGEPGGGPFWVKDESGKLSLQIVESAQIDKRNTDNAKILANATHFNPVDIVCGIKDYKGNRFNLTDFVDDKAAFISMKTKGNHNIKALELPGLWNGSMAYWNTIFVEVPIITFNPVKTVNDLLKSPHQIRP